MGEISGLRLMRPWRRYSGSPERLYEFGRHPVRPRRPFPRTLGQPFDVGKPTGSRTKLENPAYAYRAPIVGEIHCPFVGELILLKHDV
jgi:hypothetical protein